LKKTPYGIHWFRRDLRIAGNPALRRSWKLHQRCVLGVFFFDSKFLSRPDFSHNRFEFFLSTLRKLKVEMLRAGGDLLVLDSGPDAGFKWILDQAKKAGWDPPATVSFNRDYEPFAQERDKRITQALLERGVEVLHDRDHLLIEPTEISGPSSERPFYQVYTPFYKAWFRLFEEDETQERITEQQEALDYLNLSAPPKNLFSLQWQQILGAELRASRDALERFIDDNGKRVTIEIPATGTRDALKRLEKFSHVIDCYKKDRDFPALDATSRMSMYFKNGSMTPALALHALKLNAQSSQASEGRIQFLKEIVWREFYYAILFHRPDVEHQAFLPQFRNLAWENNEAFFEAWKEGRTGYPIVDAAMRELRQTGWMHNRCRMIVASFLTKDLLIDWRWGERYFMEQLLDGDLAPNNGGWQWAASTGCDPQPYFRIFNPILQSRKFDPNGEYIRRYVPELRHLKDDSIHAPWKKGGVTGYPAPIVDHAKQREKALKLYR
jgi:deoxyribodipyrimidine photo-lyase